MTTTKPFSIWSLLVFVSPKMIVLAQDCYSDAWGTEFYVGFPGSDTGSYYMDVKLQILAEGPGEVTVSNGNVTSFQSTRNVRKGVTTIQIPSTLVHNQVYTYQNMGFRISSTVQVSTVVTMYKNNIKMFDSMLLLPTAVLSNEYVVPFNGDMAVLIVGLESNTQFQVRYQTQYGPSGVLGQYQTYLLHNSSAPDTFSCSISSTKPIAVFMGKTRQTGLEQAIPVNNWGKKYVIPKVIFDHSFRLLAARDDTYITFDTTPPWHIIAHSGQMRQSNMYGSSLFLQSNQTIMALEYSTSYDKFLTTLPAITQFESRYTFLVPDVQDYYTYSHYVTVIFETNGFDGLILDEVNIPAWTDKTSAGEYTVATFRVLDPGYHVITVTEENAFGYDLDRFGGIVHGYNTDSGTRAYAHPLGMVLNTDNQGCTSKKSSSRRANPQTNSPASPYTSVSTNGSLSLQSYLLFLFIINGLTLRLLKGLHV